MTTEHLQEGLPTDALTLRQFQAQIDTAIVKHIAVTLTVGSIAGILVFAGLAMLPDQTPQQRMARAGFAAVLVFTSLIAWLISRRWGLRMASAFFSTTAFIVSISSAYMAGLGLASTGAMVPAAWIVVMGMTVSPKAGIVAMRLAIAGVLVLWAAQWQGLIPGVQAHNVQPPASYAAVLILIFLLIGSTIKHFSKLFWNAMRAIDGARSELQAKVAIQEKTQQALLEHKRRLAVLLDHAPLAVLMFDKDTGQLTYANQNALKTHGVQDFKELCERCLFQAPPYSQADLLRHIHDTRDEGVQHVRWHSRTLQGERIWWDVKLDMLTIDDAPHVVSFGHDITTRLKAEQALLEHRAQLAEQVRARTAEVMVQQRRLESVIEALPVSLSIKDTQGRYQLSNRLFEACCGQAKQALLGHTPEDLFEPTAAQQARLHDTDLLNGTPTVRYEYTCTHGDGLPRDQFVTKVALKDAQGQTEAILTLAVDISEQKDMQRQLAAAKNEAERLSSVKTAFLANMSHEIRTPLHGVLGLAQVGQALPPGDARMGDLFKRITQSGRHLLGVINDILDFSKIEAGKLSIQVCPLDPHQLAADAVAMVEERAAAKGLTLRLRCDTPPPIVMGDALRIGQIIINLLSNAIKFTEQGSITLSLYAGDGQLRFAIEDTGIGMHPEAQARVFSPFEQADGSTSRKFGGTGLGLSISRKLARLMDGDILLRSTLGAGSTFTLTLPLQQVDPARLRQAADPTGELVSRQADSTGAPSGPRLKGLHILVADDVDTNRDILDALLTQEEAEVHCAQDGRHAIQLHKAHGPGYFDVVLMDVQMPVMNGLQATELLLMREPDLPVLALTAHAMAEERQHCVDAGMVGHLAKPFEVEDMIAMIARHARRAQGARTASPPSSEADAGPAMAGSAACQVDFDAALQRCGHQQALLHKLMARFAHEQADFTHRCQKLLADSPDQARRAAHMLKGTAGNLGMQAISDMAGELEDALTANDAARIGASLHGLQLALAQHIALLKDWLKTHVAA